MIFSSSHMLYLMVAQQKSLNVQWSQLTIKPSQRKKRERKRILKEISPQRRRISITYYYLLKKCKYFIKLMKSFLFCLSFSYQDTNNVSPIPLLFRISLHIIKISLNKYISFERGPFTDSTNVIENSIVGTYYWI